MGFHYNNMDEQNGVKEEGDMRLDIPPTLDASLLMVLFQICTVMCSPERWIQRLQSPCFHVIGKYSLQPPILFIQIGYTDPCTNFSRYGIQMCLVERANLLFSLQNRLKQIHLFEIPFQWFYLLP